MWTHRLAGDRRVTLREYFESLLAAMDLRYQQRYDAQNKALDAALLAAERAVQTALTAAEKAVNKAEIAAEKRFESVNEFRGQLADQALTFMPRLEAEQRLSAMGEQIAELKSSVSLREGRSTGLTAGWGYLVGVVVVVGAVVAIIVGLQ